MGRGEQIAEIERGIQRGEGMRVYEQMGMSGRSRVERQGVRGGEKRGEEVLVWRRDG